MNINGREYLDIVELSEYKGIAIKDIQSLVESEAIPITIIFDKEEIDDWWKSYQQLKEKGFDFLFVGKNLNCHTLKEGGNSDE